MVLLLFLLILFIELRLITYLNRLSERIIPLDDERNKTKMGIFYRKIIQSESKFSVVLNIFISLVAYYIGYYLVNTSKMQLNAYYWCGIVLEYSSIFVILLSICYLFKNILSTRLVGKNKKSTKEFTEFANKVLTKDDKGLSDLVDKSSDNKE